MISTKDNTKPYYFSLALHTGEVPATIIQNRQTLADALGDEALHFIVANQTHSDNIEIITTPATHGWQRVDDAIINCDSLITQQRNLVLTILTADCVPILLYDPVHEVIAAIHAGWKGTQSQIVSKTLKKMVESFGTQTENIIAGIAPAIGECCYEVGEDVAKHFSHIPHAYTPKKEKYMLNLPYINKKQLIDAGVHEINIEMSNICTACEVNRFFSYRKEQGCSGRFMSMIMLKDK
jgi:hypothetical protein